jgi:CubicO group peptidase (beta-lactamase class C family)
MARMLAIFLVAARLLTGDARSEAADRILAPLRSPTAPGCALGVIEDGRFVYTTAFGLADLEGRTPITIATPFNVASMTKQFTAAAIYLLIDERRLRLSDSVRRFVPELPDYAAAMTVADLLHHTSGLRDIHPILEISGRLNQPLDLGQNLKILAAQSALNFAAGTDYEYTNADYILLALIVERTTSRPLAEFAVERILRPLGMTHSGFRPSGAVGYTANGVRFRQAPPPPLSIGDGGLYTTVEDLLLWDQHFYADRRFAEFMETRGRLRNGQPIYYAAGLNVGRYRGLRVVSHDGSLPGYRSDFAQFPSERLTVVCLCNRGDAEASSLSRRVAAVYLADKLKRPPRPGIDYTTTGFPHLDGQWESKQGWLLRAWSAVDGLSIEMGGDTYKLFPLNRRQLASDAGGFRLLLTKLSTDRIELRWEDDWPVVYARLPAAQPKRADLPAYAGDYRSADASTEWRIVFEKDALLITTKGGWRIPIEAAGPDRFLVGPWSLRFVRASGGKVRGVELHRARLWNLWFDRL